MAESLDGPQTASGEDHVPVAEDRTVDAGRMAEALSGLLFAAFGGSITIAEPTHRGCHLNSKLLF